MPSEPINLSVAQSSKLRLRIMADFSCTGIWEIVRENGKWCHYPLDCEELNPSQDLGQGFDDWISSYSKEYFDHENERYHGRHYDRSQFIESFNAQGRSLANQLKRYLGEDVYVEYVPETEDSIGPAEVII